MTLFDALLLGIVEGFTEFLPISSTGHLIVVSDLIGIAQSKEHKAFEVIIQLASILAVVLNFKEEFTLKRIDLWSKITLAFIPVGAVGFLFSDIIKSLFSIQTVAIMFILGGVVFLLVEKFYDESKCTTSDIHRISYKQSFFIGFMQIFALIPGTSRAGATIIGGLLGGLDRKTSAKFSFLLALPVMVAASGYDLYKHGLDFTPDQTLTLITGFIIAFFVAYLTIKFFLRFLEQFTFTVFGIYRILFGLLLLIFFVK